MAKKASTLVTQGAILLGVLTEGVTPTDVATPTNLDKFIAGTKAPYSFALDAEAPATDLETYFNEPRDTSILIDLKTMKIVDIIESDIARAMAELQSLLTPSALDAGVTD